LNSFLSRPKRKNRKGTIKKIKTQKQKKYSNGIDKASKKQLELCNKNIATNIYHSS